MATTLRSQFVLVLEEFLDAFKHAQTDEQALFVLDQLALLPHDFRKETRLLTENALQILGRASERLDRTRLNTYRPPPKGKS